MAKRNFPNILTQTVAAKVDVDDGNRDAKEECSNDQTVVPTEASGNVWLSSQDTKCYKYQGEQPKDRSNEPGFSCSVSNWCVTGRS